MVVDQRTEIYLSPESSAAPKQFDFDPRSPRYCSSCPKEVYWTGQGSHAESSVEEEIAVIVK